MGRLGQRKRWRWSETVQIIDTNAAIKLGGKRSKAIQIEGPKKIQLGTFFGDEETDYIYYALRYYLDMYNRKKYIR